jgi:hypothetical protein
MRSLPNFRALCAAIIMLGLGVAASAADARSAQAAPSANNAPYWSQIARLTSKDLTGYLLGWSVAMDGDTLVAGAPNSQEALVYVKPSSGWGDMNQVATLIQSEKNVRSNFAPSVAISGDVIVVGSPFSIGSCGCGSGSVYLYLKPPGGWAGTLTETAKLTSSDGQINDVFGTSLAMSGDTVVVGAPAMYSLAKPGAAYVFVKPVTGWTNMTQTAKLVPSASSNLDYMGQSVAISGNTILVGAPGAAYSVLDEGVAYVFVEPAGGWVNMTQTAQLGAANGVKGDNLGFSVALSGSTALVGAPFHATNGVAYVYVAPKTGWQDMTETAELARAGKAARLAEFGFSVAVDGSTAVVGAPDLFLPYTYGAAFVFDEPAGGWVNTLSPNSTLTGADARVSAYSGTGVAVKGNIIVVGAASFRFYYFSPTKLRRNQGTFRPTGSVYLFSH